MLDRLKRCVLFVLDPPWQREGPDNFTLAVSESHSTFKRGDVGWPNRPPAVVRCPDCDSTFTQMFANDYIDCPDCHFECSPDTFKEMELIGLVCPHCQTELDTGYRHPNLVEVPEWASCTDCQYHWEYQHDYSE